MATATPGRLPFDILVGVHPPEHWAGLESGDRPHRYELEAERYGRRWERPALARDSILWERLGVAPRFVGSETTACVAALQPSVFHGDGADEFDRFLAAAAHRGESALIVSTIGTPNSDDFSRSVFGGVDDSVLLPGAGGSIGGRRLPVGGSARLAEGLTGADRDLALRILNESEGSWWSIHLQRSVLQGVQGSRVVEPGGRIEPLLVNELGETVAGVWLPDGDRAWRWYVLPGGTDWPLIISWLVDRALPEFVPGAVRRARASELVDEDLLTSRELNARNELAQFDEESSRRRADLVRAVETARTEAGSIRDGLLHGTGKDLVDAVELVLRGAGLNVENLDETVGSGRSADLLVWADYEYCLIEVKSAAGMPSEDLSSDLDRHLRTWPQLGRTQVVNRSALIINHQHREPPLSRSSEVYKRPEFLASLRHTVVPSLALFAWWRDARHKRVADVFLHEPTGCYAVDLSRASDETAAGRPSEGQVSLSEGTAVPRSGLRWRRRQS